VATRKTASVSLRWQVSTPNYAHKLCEGLWRLRNSNRNPNRNPSRNPRRCADVPMYLRSANIKITSRFDKAIFAVEAAAVDKICLNATSMASYLSSWRCCTALEAEALW
jgi:hypothetical protein